MFDWITAASLCLALIGLGVGMLSVPPEPQILLSRLCFIGAAIALVIKAVWWGLESKDSNIVRFVACGFIGVIAIVGLVESLRWTERKAVDFSKNEGVLIPAGLPNPRFLCPPPDGALKVILGGSLAWATRFPHIVIAMSDQQMLTIDRDESTGTLRVVTLRMLNDRNEIIARIDEDGFWVRNDIRKKRPNRSTLVVYDQTDTEVLYIEMLNSETVSILGQFRHPKTGPIIIDRDRISMGGNAFSSICFGEVIGGPDLAIQ